MIAPLNSHRVIDVTRSLRYCLKLTQQDLAERIGVSRSQYNRWERKNFVDLAPHQEEALRKAAKELLIETSEKI